MSAITPEYLDELRARISPSAVVGQRVGLVKRGREYSGLCPFHDEKTPSFTVNDEKGFYHCFGCGAHGDIITFVMETEGLNFIETVERLSEQVGMQMPRFSKEEREKSEKRATLYDVAEAVALWFEEQLQGKAGQQALQYATRRGLQVETLRRFRLGYAPNQKGLLLGAMKKKGFTEQQLIDIGVLKQADEDTGRPKKKAFHDFFIHRLMFPITDRRGRVIAYGGRALGESRAKYLNSPDTPLFQKGRILYNMANARKAAYDSGELLIVEGYMDVITLAQAGFGATVAPLGTAVTVEQIEELWRMAPEPVLCLDGDAAGQRAAYRVVDRALPILGPGLSLCFAYLPEGEDPDSLIQSQGTGALRKILEDAKPLSDVLWTYLLSRHNLSTPEKRAALKKDIRQQASRIKDRDLKNEYLAELLSRYDDVVLRRQGTIAGGMTGLRQSGGGGGGYRGYGTRGGRTGKGSSFKRGARGRFENTDHFDARLPRPVPPQRNKLSVSASRRRQEQVLLAALINHPSVLLQHLEELTGLKLLTPELDRLLRDTLDRIFRDPELDSLALKCQLSEAGYSGLLDSLLVSAVYNHGFFARPSADSLSAEFGVGHVVSIFRERQAYEGKEKRIGAYVADDLSKEALRRLEAEKQLLEEAIGTKIDLDGIDIDFAPPEGPSLEEGEDQKKIRGNKGYPSASNKV